ncbi:fungal-specific transcription factor [Thelonectria olida]|uniref:Fungal-specific transcription factor n=1 Tax=Thelonectria olida TaxID=1576542 RepID=A0A9P8VUI9_9HYPO|nr:fungal-specific transcription factor [Thelonectria olida]
MSRRFVTPGRSCLECRRRKIRCDRSLPCAYCVRIRNKCEYPPSPQSKNSESHHSIDLASRVEHLEDTFQSLHRSGPYQAHRVDPLEQGQDDLQHPRSSQFPLNAPVRPFFYHFASETSPSPTSLHPPPAVIPFIWQTYLEVVDPVLKLFHVPTVQEQVMRFVRCPVSLDNSTECLMFAIYYSTVVTMPAAMCWTYFNESKTTLSKRFRTGVEQSLLRANFLRSRDVIVLQALVLYTYFARQDRDGPDTSQLVAIAVGSATRMGLNYENEALRLPPFDIELRRRLWWQLYVLDGVIAIDNEIEPTITETICNTEMPSNVNDVSLDSAMLEQPQSEQRKTDMTFTLTRLHTSRLSRQMLFSGIAYHGERVPLTVTQKLQMIDSAKRDMEERYLVHCDPSIALDFVTIATTRLYFLKLQSVICRPVVDAAKEIPPSSDYRAICHEILHQSHALRQYGKRETRWLWLFETCAEWDVLAYSLLDVCVAPTRDAYDLVEGIYNDWKSDTEILQDHRWSRIEHLHSQMLVARENLQTTAVVPQRTLTDERLSARPREGHRESPDAILQENVNETTQLSPGSTPSIGHNLSSVIADSSVDRSENGLHPSRQRVNDNIRAIAATPVVLGGPMSEDSDLPTTGTACEWTADILQQYNEVIALGHSKDG